MRLPQQFENSGSGSGSGEAGAVKLQYHQKAASASMRTKRALVRGEQSLHLGRVFESLCNLMNGDVRVQRIFAMREANTENGRNRVMQQFCVFGGDVVRCVACTDHDVELLLCHAFVAADACNC